jgi:hypothetical protein
MLAMLVTWATGDNPILQWLLVATWPLPAIIGYWRHHHRRHLILFMTFLLGWLNLIWAAVLVWSITGKTEPREPQ